MKSNFVNTLDNFANQHLGDFLNPYRDFFNLQTVFQSEYSNPGRNFMYTFSSKSSIFVLVRMFSCSQPLLVIRFPVLPDALYNAQWYRRNGT